MLRHLLKTLWTRWKPIAHTLATFQSRILLSLFYFTVLAPFAIAMKALADPLQLRPTTHTIWIKRPAPDGGTTLIARRQF